jgi:hypothetical protein
LTNARAAWTDVDPVGRVGEVGRVVDRDPSSGEKEHRPCARVTEEEHDVANSSFKIDVTLKKKTDAALLVEDEDGEEAWVPLSQVLGDSEITQDSEVGDEGLLSVPGWLAKEKSWS